METITNLEQYYLDQGGHYSKFEEWEKNLSSYQRGGINFLLKTGTKFKAVLIGHDKYFDSDKETRDIYRITLTRKDKAPWEFRFGQSIADSGPNLKTNYVLKAGRHTPKKENCSQYRKAPEPYEILARLTKYDPGTFEDFCSEFGYDSDSRSAEKTYFAVQEEYRNVCRLWTAAEREELEEIS